MYQVRKSSNYTIPSDNRELQLFGWFTLATYLINEIRSILENLVEMNVNVPQFLIAGLDITQKLLDSKTEIKESEVEVNGK